MSRIRSQGKQDDRIFAYSPPQSPLTSLSSPYTMNNGRESATALPPSPRISPILLLVIVILAAVFFVSGLLHLLVRFLMKKPSSSIFDSDRYAESSDSSLALQRQLQQLFRLHDSGLEQAFIDALPVFYYKDIIGLKEPFDCAVCLCAFTQYDKLRLLPMCSHAFHMSCIDTWLLSNSTCPLCRGSLVDQDLLAGRRTLYSNDSWRLPSTPTFPMDTEDSIHCGPKPVINEGIASERRVFSVRLGKFRSSNDRNDNVEISREADNGCLDSRRCYSMGSYQYVVGEMDLQVALSPCSNNCADSKIGDTRGWRQYRIYSRNEEGKKIGWRSKGDSFSVSKIWLWSKNSGVPSSSDAHVGVSHHTTTLQNEDTSWEVQPDFNLKILSSQTFI